MSCELCKPYADSVEGKPATNCPRCGREVIQILSTPDRTPESSRGPGWNDHLPRPHRIGVYDYESLIGCLKTNYQAAFSGDKVRDPQDAIQQLSAEVLNLRAIIRDKDLWLRKYGSLVSRFDAALRAALGVNPAWTENGVREFAVEALRKVLGSETPTPVEDRR